MNDQNQIFVLDLLGQTPQLNLYTQITICYHVTDENLYPAILASLAKGLDHLYTSFSWLSGNIINEGSGDGSSGIFKIELSSQYPTLAVKDLRNDTTAPTMKVLQETNFPISKLDESILAPRKTLQGPLHPDDQPIFMVQATLVQNGLLLTFIGHHMAMDGVGQGQVIDLFNKACYISIFTPEELAVGNLNRSNLVPTLSEVDKVKEVFAHQIVSPPTTPTKDVPNPPKCIWANFSFSPTALSTLKQIATDSKPSWCEYVSTDDVLTAFIWQSILRIRSCRIKELSTTVKFARAVDARRYLDLPATYSGVAQNMTYHQYCLGDLLSASIGEVAADFRKAVDPKTSNLVYDTRALATLFENTLDKGTINVTATLDLSRDIMLSSWAKLDCYELDFNLGLGKPRAVRRPRFEGVESLMYLMPKATDGEITLTVCLRDEDMVMLKNDDGFCKYGAYLG